MEEKKSFTSQTLHLDNRKFLSLTGVTKMLNANPDCVLVEVGNSNLKIDGKNLHIAKLDVDSGLLNVSGVVNAMKYVKDGERESLLKRIFK